jgi:hypothetical protein
VRCWSEVHLVGQRMWVLVLQYTATGCMAPGTSAL